jgi:hypothetical protein
MNKPEDEKQNDMEKEPIRYERFVEDFNETTMTCLPICNTCVHHVEGLTCKAFDVIPDIILFGDNDHSKPMTHQKNDLVYQKKIKL